MRLDALQERLPDRRSRRVVFVSHCLLNENVRYLGGACRPGVVGGLVRDWQAQDVGICQMPCPEQYAWGGVMKRLTAPAYGAEAGRLWPVRSLLLAVFTAYTRARYRRLARRVAGEMGDYVRSGFSVAGLVGVGGSPSCGVRTTLDVRRWLEVVGRYRESDLEPGRMNSEAIAANAVPGQGWFIQALDRRLHSAGIEVPYTEHDLLAELARTAGTTGGEAGRRRRRRLAAAPPVDTTSWPATASAGGPQREPGLRAAPSSGGRTATQTSSRSRIASSRATSK